MSMLLKFVRDQLRDSYARLLNMRGNRLWQNDDLPRAERYFRAAIAANKSLAPNYSNLGAVLMELHRYEEGFAMLEHAANLNPSDARILVNLGNAYYRSGRVKPAIDVYNNALEIDPGNIEASANLIRPLMEICDWDSLDRHLGKIMSTSTSSDPTAWRRRITPFDSLFLPLTRVQQLQIAQEAALRWTRTSARMQHAMVSRERITSSRLRIGYLSSDFHDHATAHLTLGIYGKHNRSRFEIYAYSIGYPDSSGYRKKIAEDCDIFVDVHDRSAREIAAHIANDRIDILVDLKGYTGGSRPGIFALRPAPVQVNYLGYPGTMGANFIDFIIADPIVIPESHSADYSEKVIRLPDSYQPTDDEQLIADYPVDRREAGLPAEGFIFCCFNTSAKIDKRSFSCWMKILARVPKSVLWLLQTSPAAQANLANSAYSSGIDPARIVYAKMLPKPQHLNRLRLADLILDTFTYNAHTTATDALWSGVPIVTLTGETFASRVATSLVRVVGVAHLATRTEEQYVDLAVAIAGDRERLEELRNKLLLSKKQCLFNTSRYVRNLESAYEEMYSQCAR